MACFGLPRRLPLLLLITLVRKGSTCGTNTWHPSWTSSADEACALWAHSSSWGALKNGQSLEEACQAQTDCDLTCCPYLSPPPYPPAVPASHPQRPPPPPELIFVLEGDLAAAEREMLDELGMSGHHAFHFGTGLACLGVLILLTATCVCVTCLPRPAPPTHPLSPLVHSL